MQVTAPFMQVTAPPDERPAVTSFPQTAVEMMSQITKFDFHWARGGYLYLSFAFPFAQYRNNEM